MDVISKRATGNRQLITIACPKTVGEQDQKRRNRQNSDPDHGAGNQELTEREPNFHPATPLPILHANQGLPDRQP